MCVIMTKWLQVTGYMSESLKIRDRSKDISGDLEWKASENDQFRMILFTILLIDYSLGSINIIFICIQSAHYILKLRAQEIY